jgi:hypothetical protein
VTVKVAAPIFLYPDERRPPLVVAKEGSLIRVVGEDGDWYNVEFRDPALGVRVGFIQKKNVSALAPDSSRPPATDVSVAPPLSMPPNSVESGETPTTNPQTRSEIPRSTNRTSTVSSGQRGDVAIGYAFLHYADTNLPVGIIGSDSWRVSRAADIVLEGGFSHGQPFPGVGLNTYTFLAGVRGSGRSRYGSGTSAFGQLLAGIGRTSVGVTLVGELLSQTYFSLQPGTGVEVPISRVIALRPQFDVPIRFANGEVDHIFRFNINVVFRLFNDQAP